MTKRAVWTFGAIAACAVAIFFAWPGRAPTAHDEPRVADEPIPPAASNEPQAPLPSAEVDAAPPSAADAGAVSRKRTRPLSTPRATVDAQVDLLAAADYEGFRDAFLPEVQAQVTREAFAACRMRVLGHVLRPDWAVAEDKVVQGRHVVRVSMYGKSMTGFVELAPNEWRAESSVVLAAWAVNLMRKTPLLLAF